MPFAAAVVTGAATAYSAYSASKAAKSGQRAQAESAAAANNLAQQQYEQTRQDTMPAMQRGDEAASRLQYLMGLQSTPETSSSIASRAAKASIASLGAPMEASVRQRLDSGDWNLPANNSPGMQSADAIQRGWESTPMNEGSSKRSLFNSPQYSNDSDYGSLSRNFSENDLRNDALYQQMQPYINQANYRSVNPEQMNLSESGLTDIDSSNYRPLESETFKESDGYEFRRDQGRRGVESSAAARGGLLSGAAMKAMERFGQGIASEEYGNWFNRANADRGFRYGLEDNNRNFRYSRLNNDRNFRYSQSNADRSFISGVGDAAYNRYNSNQNSQYNRLAAIAGTGQQATNQVNTLGARSADYQGQNLMGAGNAYAASKVAQSNAYSQGLKGLAGAYTDFNLMNQPNSSLYDYQLGVGSSYNGSRKGL